MCSHETPKKTLEKLTQQRLHEKTLLKNENLNEPIAMRNSFMDDIRTGMIFEFETIVTALHTYKVDHEVIQLLLESLITQFPNRGKTLFLKFLQNEVVTDLNLLAKGLEIYDFDVEVEDYILRILTEMILHSVNDESLTEGMLEKGVIDHLVGMFSPECRIAIFSLSKNGHIPFLKRYGFFVAVFLRRTIKSAASVGWVLM